jgi:ABC-type uncharacterized transport system auxiliary subunit
MNRRLILLAPCALAACTSLLPAHKYIARTSWPLDPQPPVQNPASPSGPILMVRSITAAPGLDQQGLQSLAPDGSLKIDYYNNWAVEPADAVTQALISWCQASGAFAAVIPPGSRLTPTVIVEGELTQFLADPARAQASAVLTLVLIRPASGITTAALPLAQTRLTGTTPLMGGTFAAQAAAQSAALANVLAQSVALIIRTF